MVAGSNPVTPTWLSRSYEVKNRSSFFICIQFAYKSNYFVSKGWHSAKSKWKIELEAPSLNLLQLPKNSQKREIPPPYKWDYNQGQRIKRRDDWMKRSQVYRKSKKFQQNSCNKTSPHHLKKCFSFEVPTHILVV